MKVLFVSSSGKVFKTVPFIKSQMDSIRPLVNEMHHYQIPGGLSSYFKVYGELKRKLKKEQYDIIHAHWSYSGMLCALLVRRERLIVSFMGNDLHGYYSSKLKLLTLRGLFEIILSQILIVAVDGIVVKSRRMMKWVPYWFRSKARVIPNGVNLEVFKNINQEAARRALNLELHKKYVAFLADPSDQNKNYSLLQRACGRVRDQNLRFDVLVPFPLPPSQIPLYLAAADVLAFPSKKEGSPNIVKEALAMGCPIVATDVGDVRERLAGIDGCFVVKQDETEFTEMLIKALAFNKRVNGEAAISQIENSVIAKRMVAFYQEILNTDLRVKSNIRVEYSKLD